MGSNPATDAVAGCVCVCLMHSCVRMWACAHCSIRVEGICDAHTSPCLDSSSLVSCHAHPHTGLSLLAISLQGQGDFTGTCTMHLALVWVLRNSDSDLHACPASPFICLAISPASFLKTITWGWRNSSVVKEHCPWTGPEFSSQHCVRQFMTVCNSSTRTPSIFLWPSPILAHTPTTHTQTHTFKNRIKSLNRTYYVCPE